MSSARARTATPHSVSVIVCAYTHERWDQLQLAVRSAHEQLVDGDELIVVIDHNDSLLADARSTFRDVAIVVENSEVKGLSGARNSGVAAARGDLSAFLDDDAHAQAGWLEHLVAPFDDADIVGTGGFASPMWETAAPRWMPDEFLWVVGCSYVGLPDEVAPIRNPIGCSMAFRTEAIRVAGGFPHDLGRVDKRPAGGEETDLSINITTHQGGTIVQCPESVVSHAVMAERATLGYFTSRCYFEGRSKAILADRVGTGDATAAERTYLRTLAVGVGRRLVRPTDGRLSGLAQAGAILLGLGTTTLGFGVGLITRKFRT